MGFLGFGRYLKPPVDFYDLLDKQAAKTLEGVQMLAVWFQNGLDDSGEKVRSLEREADALKFDLQRKLIKTFTTPFDREDIYDLSVRLDEVINAAKAVVREMEAMEIAADDEFLQEMVAMLVEGTSCLAKSFSNLQGNRIEAADQAFWARKSENRLTKVYRQAMHELFQHDDVKTILRTHEVYRYLMQAASKIDVVGEKLIHVIIKIS